MKKIINGRKYDTTTAKECGWGSNDLPRTDFGYFSETLFQKKTGEFFLYGWGGAMSKYAVSCGQNQRSDGEAITPLNIDSAKRWAEKYLSADEYESIFGEVEE